MPDDPAALVERAKETVENALAPYSGTTRLLPPYLAALTGQVEALIAALLSETERRREALTKSTYDGMRDVLLDGPVQDDDELQEAAWQVVVHYRKAIAGDPTRERLSDLIDVLEAVLLADTPEPSEDPFDRGGQVTHVHRPDTPEEPRRYSYLEQPTPPLNRPRPDHPIPEEPPE